MGEVTLGGIDTSEYEGELKKVPLMRLLFLWVVAGISTTLRITSIGLSPIS